MCLFAVFESHSLNRCESRKKASKPKLRCPTISGSASTTMSTDWMIHGARKAVEDIQGNDDDTPDGVKFDPHGGLSHVALTDILSTAVTTIAILDVSGCCLTSIPNAIDRLVNLQYLRIESNDLKALPRSMQSQLPDASQSVC